MGTFPDKIHYVRERTVDSQEREVVEKTMKERGEEPQREKGKKGQNEAINENKQETEFWPRKRRSDITMSRFI